MMAAMPGSRPSVRTRSPAVRPLVGMAFVLLAMAGAVIGHATVWSLVGGASPGLAAARSIHNYLRPVGAALLVLAAGTSWVVWRAWAVLGAIAARVRRALRQPAPASPVPLCVAREAGARPSLGALWGSLAVVQLCVYSVQENVEAHLADVPLPGARVVTVSHGAPIVLHAAVALGLAAIITAAGMALDRRRRTVERMVRVLRAVSARRGLVRPPAVGTGVGLVAPLARFGLSFVSRPPPVVAG